MSKQDLYEKSSLELNAAYARSKFANVVHMLDLSRRLKSKCITVNCMEPGLVDTDMTRFSGISGSLRWFIDRLAPMIMLSGDQGALTGIWLALSPDVHAVSGKMFADLSEHQLTVDVQKFDGEAFKHHFIK